MNRDARVLALAGALLGLLAGCGGAAPTAPAPEPGAWRAWLESPGGELPFGLELDADGGVIVINGPERRDPVRWTIDGPELTIELAPYDARIEAALDPSGRRLDGRWLRASAGDGIATLPFHAVAGDAPRFASLAATGEPRPFDGRWAVRFERDEHPSVGVMRQAADGTVEATFLNATGDYRYLAGRVDGDRLRLSTFDGAHAFLFDARMDADGAIAGEFWSRDTWHERWTAERDGEARPVDGFELTHGTPDGALSDLSFPDLDGTMRTLDDPAFRGPARLIVVFGSWCPNCNDATRYLVELHRRHAARGLSIVGLAYELTGRFEDDAARVRAYAAYHGIEYPLLIAGTSDKDAASATLPLIDRVQAFPTILFLDGDGRVRAVHAGFSGPATGEAHRALRDRFESLIESLLEEGA